MPAHPTRWGRLALAFLMLFVLAAAPVGARPNYTLNEDCEGDPGDGVLDPAVVASGWKPSPELSTAADAPLDRTIMLLPVLTLPGWSGAPVLMLIPADAWTSAWHGLLIPAGRWHDAR